MSYKKRVKIVPSDKFIEPTNVKIRYYSYKLFLLTLLTSTGYAVTLSNPLLLATLFFLLDQYVNS